MSDIRGRFLWYETLTNDVNGAIAFYTKVIGWGTQSWDGMGTPYHMWANGEKTIGGIMQMPPDAAAPPHWLGYVGTPDVMATTARAEELGAKVFLRNMNVPTVGTMSVMQDPFGAFFAAYTPETAMPPAVPGVGDITWHEIATTDVDACLAFYGDLFGWKKLAAHDMGAMGVYLEYGLDNEPLGGIYLKPADMPAPPHIMYYIRVDDLEATMARVTEHGGTVMLGPHEVPGGDRIAMCADPQGAAFALHWKKA
jgi:hypothetical protein